MDPISHPWWTARSGHEFPAPEGEGVASLTVRYTLRNQRVDERGARGARQTA